MKVNLWVTSPESLLQFQLAESDSERLKTLYLDPELTSDMSEYGWVHVGSAEIQFDFESSREKLMNDALKVLDLKEQELRADLRRKLDALEEMRGKLLALPSPVREES